MSKYLFLNQNFKYNQNKKIKKVLKIKKFSSLAIIAFLLLSNIAFAQTINLETDTATTQNLDESNSFSIILDSASSSGGAAESFAKGEMSEDELRSMAKAKMGGKFSEMEFQKMMLEMKQRSSRKDSFSYEHEGFGKGYDSGPSYEGYSKKQMIFGMLFEKIKDDIDPREIHQDCNDPNKITASIMAKLKEKVGDFQKVCSGFDEKESKCSEVIRQSCSQIGTPAVMKDSNDAEKINALAYSCPPNKDAIIAACRFRAQSYIQQRTENLGEMCMKRFDLQGERLQKECEKFRQSQLCDKEKFMARCMAGVKKEPVTEASHQSSESGFRYSKWECYDGFSESQGSAASCKSSEMWNGYARKSCGGRCSSDKLKCGVNSFSVSGECREGAPVSECPVQELPKCGEGYSVQKRINERGCPIYYCEPHVISCQADAQQCPGGSYVKRVPPNCNFQPCPAAACAKPACDRAYDSGKRDSSGCVVYACPSVCPEAAMPSCLSGSTAEKKVDERGCVYYYCAAKPCSEVQKPSCSSAETVQAYYDSAGCVSSYQCISETRTCPAVEKPSCREDQSMTVKYGSNKCIVGYECINVAATGSAIFITGNAVMGKYDDFMQHCSDSWLQQEKTCSSLPSICDKGSFIEKCKEQEKNNFADHTAKIESSCNSETESQVKFAEQRCSKISEERERCVQQGTKRCGQVKGLSSECKTILTEENVMKFLEEEVRKKCRFTGIIEDESKVRDSDKAEIVLAVLNTVSEDDLVRLSLFVDGLKEDLKLQDTTVYRGTIDPGRFGDIKLLPFVVNAKLSALSSSDKSKEVKAQITAGTKAEESAGKLASLRDSNVPDEYLYIIEDKASDVLDVSDNLKDLEKKEGEKGFGYGMKRFFGLAQKAEQEEIKQLEESKTKLQNSIETLSKLADEVPSDVAKSILKEQVENLKKQIDDIGALIKSKQKKAKGLFGIFG